MMDRSGDSEVKRLNDCWKSIIINDQQFFICVEEEHEQWKIYLTNLQEIWTETLDRTKIVEKCQRLNPSLSIEDVDVVQLVKELLNEIDKKVAKKSIERIEFYENLYGGIFRFFIDFERGTSTELWEKVTRRLCLFAGELQRRQEILLNLLRKKDEEITEYRLNGAELTRKHIHTEPFHSDLFKQNVPKINTHTAFNAFKSIMNSQDELGYSIELGILSATRTTKSEEHHDKPMESETKIKTELKESEIKNGLNENEVAEIKDESSVNTIPKIEKSNSSLLEKQSKNRDSENKKGVIRRQARSAPSSSVKRSKKSIYDFIS